MGLLGTLVAGAAEGGGQAGEKVALTKIESDVREAAAQRLQEHQAKLQEGMATRAEERGLINRATERTNVFNETLERAPQLADLEVEKQKKLNIENTRSAIDQFTKMEPLKRQAAIDEATAKVTALSTPEMLKNTHAIAAAQHIVDPAFALVPNADGTVTTFDAHSGKSGGLLKGPDGEPIVRKDPEETKAAVAVVNMANTNLKIAETAYRTELQSVKDPTTDPKEKAATTAKAETAWAEAQAEAKRITAPALAVLYGKAKATPEPTAKPEKPAAKVKTYNPATKSFD